MLRQRSQAYGSSKQSFLRRGARNLVEGRCVRDPVQFGPDIGDRSIVVSMVRKLETDIGRRPRSLRHSIFDVRRNPQPLIRQALRFHEILGFPSKSANSALRFRFPRLWAKNMHDPAASDVGRSALDVRVFQSYPCGCPGANRSGTVRPSDRSIHPKKKKTRAFAGARLCPHHFQWRLCGKKFAALFQDARLAPVL